jgi:hypothetical protein
MRSATCRFLVVAGLSAAVMFGGRSVYATPSIGAVTATPSRLVIGTPTEVTFTTHIDSSLVIPGSVNLLQTDANGNVIAQVATFTDGGDNTYSARISITSAALGEHQYRVSAAFLGLLLRTVSEPVTLYTVNPNQSPIARFSLTAGDWTVSNPETLDAHVDRASGVARVTCTDASTDADGAVDITSREWRLDGQSVAACAGAISCAFDFSVGGPYSVTLIVRDSYNHESTASAPVNVGAPWPTLSTLPNTGITAEGDADPNYQLIAGPTCPTGPCTTFSSSRDGLPNTAASKWIQPVGGAASTPIGRYVYRLMFYVSDAEAPTAVVAGRWAAYATGDDIRVNGATTGWRAPNALGFVPFRVTGFKPGINSLEFVVSNELRVEFDDPSATSTTPLIVPLVWTRSKEDAASVFVATVIGAGAEPGRGLSVDPDQIVFDNGAWAFFVNTPAGNDLATWHQYFGTCGQTFETRRFETTFIVPPGLGRVRDVVLFSPYYTDQDFIIPINDNIYAFLNGDAIGHKGTSYTASYGGSLGMSKMANETDGWYDRGSLGTAAVTALREGTNVLDLIAEEWCGIGGMGRLNVMLTFDR